MNATISRWGNSNAVRLPKALTDALKLYENDAVQINIEGNAIVIRKRRPASLLELFEGYDGEYKSKEWDTGAPVGRELW
jgi:antitoxin MazE